MEIAPERIRNIAIIAHVDHGKTTLVDRLLQESGTWKARTDAPNRAMDSNDLERERGITILSKNTAINWQEHRINIVDTPGHADFGGEVERVLSMVDSVLLLVDAVDGPMPQTRFVTEKAFRLGIQPIVVINKIDRPGARPDWAVDQTFDLFDKLGANDEQLDFPIVYASALEGFAMLDPGDPRQPMSLLLDTIIDKVPPPNVDQEGPFQMQISALDYSSYVGVIGIGRIFRGHVNTKMPISVVSMTGEVRRGRILQILGFSGLERKEISGASAGDIVAVTGVDQLAISDTLCTRDHPEHLPPLTVDEPTISMTFCVNDGPFAGKEGKYLTSRQLSERLFQEASYNVALRVEDTANPDRFKVSGRGELHLAILLETMRREGYELAVSRPEVILHEKDGVVEEPYEQLVIDVDDAYQGATMERVGERKGELLDMRSDGKGRMRLEYHIPARGLIGFQTEFRTLTAGTGLMYHSFHHYGPHREGSIAPRRSGVLISKGQGKTLAYSLFNLQERGRLLIGAGEEVYQGQLVGIHSRNNDLTVNPLKGKQLTNIRAAGKDDALILTPPIRFSLEQAMEFIADDELVEITPAAIRLRKKLLVEHERKRAASGRGPE